MDSIIDNGTYKHDVDDSLKKFDPKGLILRLSLLVGTLLFGLLCFLCYLCRARNTIFEEDTQNNQGIEMQQAPIFEEDNTAQQRQRQNRNEDNKTSNDNSNDEENDTSTTSESGDAASERDIRGTVIGNIYATKEYDAENRARNFGDDSGVRLNVEGDSSLNSIKDECGRSANDSGVKSTISIDSVDQVDADNLSKYDTASEFSASGSLGRDSTTPLS